MSDVAQLGPAALFGYRVDMGEWDTYLSNDGEVRWRVFLAVRAMPNTPLLRPVTVEVSFGERDLARGNAPGQRSALLSQKLGAGLVTLEIAMREPVPDETDE